MSCVGKWERKPVSKVRKVCKHTGVLQGLECAMHSSSLLPGCGSQGSRVPHLPLRLAQLLGRGRQLWRHPLPATQAQEPVCHRLYSRGEGTGAVAVHARASRASTGARVERAACISASGLWGQRTP